MARDTTLNHEYDSPPKGTPRWDVPLNTNFRDLDVDVEIRGDEADRFEYEPPDGSKYFSTDTGTIYIGDGANWNQLSISSGSNADTVDNLDADQFIRSDSDDQFTGNLTDSSGNTVYDNTALHVPQTRLENDTVAVAGNAVSLGSSTDVAHGDLTNISTADHHTRPIAGTNLTEDGSQNFNVEQGDGSGLNADLWDGRELYVQSTEPSGANSGDIWIDTT